MPGGHVISADGASIADGHARFFTGPAATSPLSRRSELSPDRVDAADGARGRTSRGEHDLPRRLI
jgi:hypothetical protein